MGQLEQFSAEEREKIISLPYRAGLWLSRSDDDGGVNADYQELHALEDIIEKRASGKFSSSFVKEIMAASLDEQQKWKEWAKHIKTVETDCVAVIGFLKGRITDEDVNAYRDAVMETVTEVAKAFREVDADVALPVKAGVSVRLLWDKIKTTLGMGPETERYLNISEDEDFYF